MSKLSLVREALSSLAGCAVIGCVERDSLARRYEECAFRVDFYVVPTAEPALTPLEIERFLLEKAPGLAPASASLADEDADAEFESAYSGWLVFEEVVGERVMWCETKLEMDDAPNIPGYVDGCEKAEEKRLALKRRIFVWVYKKREDAEDMLKKRLSKPKRARSDAERAAARLARVMP